MASFSASLNDTPVVCSPSRRVVSITSIRFMLGILKVLDVGYGDRFFGVSSEKAVPAGRCLLCGLFPGRNLVFDAEQIVDVVVSVEQTFFLVGIDVEVLGNAGGGHRNALVFEIDFDFDFRVFFDGFEELRQKGIGNLHGQDAVVQGVVLEYVGKEAGHYGFKSVATNGPRSEERRVGKECRSRWSPYRYRREM